MTKAIQSFLAGIFFTFILDFFLFLGIKLNYIDLHKINVYYNILFADHQSLWLYLFFTLLLGYITIYLNRPKITVAVLAALFCTVLLGLIPSIGQQLGEALLMKKDQTLHDSRYRYHGDVYYDGREEIYIYDDELQKLIRLKKKDLKPAP